MRQPDIEIYLKDAERDAVAQWLGEALGPCSDWQQKGQTFKCKAGDVPVTWLPKAVGKWHSLYLESDATPGTTTWPVPAPPMPHSACRCAARPAPGWKTRAMKKPIAGSRSMPMAKPRSFGVQINSGRLAQAPNL